MCKNVKCCVPITASKTFYIWFWAWNVLGKMITPQNVIMTRLPHFEDKNINVLPKSYIQRHFKGKFTSEIGVKSSENHLRSTEKLNTFISMTLQVLLNQFSINFWSVLAVNCSKMALNYIDA